MSAQMLVGSYNIRLKVSSDSVNGNAWQKRCQVICDQVNFMSPDIFGAQEVLHVQLLDMLQGLDGYDYIGVGRDDGKTGGEYAAIFYKPDRLRLLDPDWAGMQHVCVSAPGGALQDRRRPMMSPSTSSTSTWTTSAW